MYAIDKIWNWTNKEEIKMMNAEKIYKMAVTGLQDYCAKQEIGYDKVWESRRIWAENQLDKTLSSLCGMAIMAEEDMYSKTAPKGTTAAMKALYKMCKDASSVKLQVAWMWENKQYMSNGNWALCLNEKSAVVPCNDNPYEEPFKLKQLFADEAQRATVEMQLPSINEIKLFIADCKAKNLKREPMQCGDLEWWCNPNFLLQIMIVLGENVTAKYDGNPVHPMCLESERGTAIVLPVKRR